MGFPQWNYPFDSHKPFDFIHRYGYGGNFIKYLCEQSKSTEDAIEEEQRYVDMIRQHALSEGFPEDFVEKIIDTFKKSNDNYLRKESKMDLEKIVKESVKEVLAGPSGSLVSKQYVLGLMENNECECKRKEHSREESVYEVTIFWDN